MDESTISPEELAPALGPNHDTGTPLQPQMQPNIDKFPVADPKNLTDSIARPAEFAPLQSPNSISSSTNLDLLLGVTLRVTVELGRTRINIEEVLRLGPGSVIELDKLAGEPVDVLVNERLIARGEVVVLDDRFGVRITDVLPPAQRINSL